MPGRDFEIRFQGKDADHHAVDMRHLGTSLVGFERIISTGLAVLVDHRLPRRGERFPLVIKVREPRPGSMSVSGALAAVSWTLPLAQEALAKGAPEIIWHWISWVLQMIGGRQKDADPHFLALIDFFGKMNASRDQNDQKQRDFILGVLDRLQRPAAYAVAPVGPSVNAVGIQLPGQDRETLVDVPMADAVRSREKLDVGDMQKIRVRVDGIIHHNWQLKVEHPYESGGYITAQVRDPVFESLPNIYTEAASVKGWLTVTAKPTFRDGVLIGLYIMDAEGAQ